MIDRRRLMAGMMGLGAAALAPLAAAGQAEDSAVATIKAFYDSVQSATAGASDPARRLAALSDAVMRTFDLGAMTRLAVGSRWASLPAAKKAELQEAFGRFFVATYASRLGQAGGGRFEVLPKTEPRSAGRLVRTRVVGPDGKATPVDYLVGPDGKVIDVYLNGTVSEVASHRAEFDAALKKGGADALAAELRRQTEALTSGR